MRDKNVAPVESLPHSTSIKQGEKDLAPPLINRKRKLHHLSLRILPEPFEKSWCYPIDSSTLFHEQETISQASCRGWELLWIGRLCYGLRSTRSKTPLMGFGKLKILFRVLLASWRLRGPSQSWSLNPPGHILAYQCGQCLPNELVSL